MSHLLTPPPEPAEACLFNIYNDVDMSVQLGEVVTYLNAERVGHGFRPCHAVMVLLFTPAQEDY